MFANKTILITGATSGIGKACAQSFATQRATVLATGRNKQRGQTLVDQLPGAGHQFIQCDLGEKVQAQTLTEIALQHCSRIDAVINSAGVVFHHSVPDTSDTAWDETMAINVNAIFYICRKVIPHMIEAGGGSIINVASTWGLVGAETTAAYCASKGAVIQLTRAMAMDHAKDNVRINAVCPGAVDTPMLESEAGAFGITADQGRDLWRSSAANNKLATAEDIANSIIFLASENASHIHGVALPVDGGALAGT